VAALMSKVLGREIQVGTIDSNKVAGNRAQSGPSAEPSPIEKMMRWYNKHGLLGNALTLRAILGCEPRTLEAYFHELKNTDAPA